MQTRNFYISVASICIAITCVWLSAYNYVRLGIDPIEYTKKSYQTIVEGEIEEEETVVVITGNVKEELKLTLSEIKSDKYNQVKDKVFKIVTRVEPYYYVYSGATLWSILESEGILEDDATTFTFVGEDGYESPEPLLLIDVAEQYESDVILAYEYDGEPLYEDGPIRSVIDDDAIPPGEHSSQYSVSNLVEVRIE